MVTKRRELKTIVSSVLEKYSVLCPAALVDEIVDAVSAFISKPKKNKQSRDQDNALYPIAVALAEVCGVDFLANRGLLMAEASRLSKAQPKPTVKLIHKHYGENGTWYHVCFAGKQGSRPWPSQVRLTWRLCTSQEQDKGFVV